ncbi:Oidioi.mRNA.OKI2018_I69.PAR.g9100.t1.cds [Oikopleura dioica]|uniref:Oidioi.mRNA.OKI2018_I69.PAR.g9100.t1.cds n=1 Tax=Oikopleura dioica TaxID=34765 RepID=A0ABN7RN19_OIKDI|nr:Oidioi.mRNA.OKI2018_I69.PAR.g9100.t1.cds [Oikopleura dioica]
MFTKYFFCAYGSYNFQPIKSNDNPYRIKDFYESRLSCNLRVDSLLYATAQRRSPLEEPNREECLSMGCCWEEDQSVLDEYPFISRCYRTERFGRESPKPALDVLKARSASFDDY